MLALLSCNYMVAMLFGGEITQKILSISIKIHRFTILRPEDLPPSYIIST